MNPRHAVASGDRAYPVPPKDVRAAASAVPVVDVMSSNVVCARPDLGVGALVELIVRKRLGCVPIVDEHHRPIGIVTKLDIVEQHGSSPAHVAVARDVMMPVPMTLSETATVAQAAALLAIEGTHHVMIVSERKLIGVISTMDITRWIAADGSSI